MGSAIGTGNRKITSGILNEKYNLLCQILSDYGQAAIAFSGGVDSTLLLKAARDALGDRAIAELGIVSPLREAGLNKAQIRELSRDMGLSAWDKPAYACLATRIPYGEEITAEKLFMVEQAEEFLGSVGFRQRRVRVHGKSARIELLPEDFARIVENGLRERVVAKFGEIGFAYVALDLKGYRTGSMNIGLKQDLTQEN